MKKYWIVIVFFVIAERTNSQPAIPDSLRLALQHNPHDTGVIKELIKSILYLPYSQPDSALYE